MHTAPSASIYHIRPPTLHPPAIYCSANILPSPCSYEEMPRTRRAIKIKDLLLLLLLVRLQIEGLFSLQGNGGGGGGCHFQRWQSSTIGIPTILQHEIANGDLVRSRRTLPLIRLRKITPPPRLMFPHMVKICSSVKRLR